MEKKNYPSRSITLNDPPYKVRYEELHFPRRYRAPKPHLDPYVEGWDTETENGRARIVANSAGWKEIYSWEEALGMLAHHHARGKRNVWWNMDYDVTALLKWNHKALELLTKDGRYESDECKLTYIPRKLLKVTTPGKHVTYHYDVSQFYNSSLAKAAARYLGREAPELKEHRNDLWSYELGLVGSYCKWDATATRDLGRLYFKSLHRLDLYPKHLISKGNVAQQFLLTHGDIPTWRDIPRMVNKIGWDAFRGGWFDLFKRGVMDAWKYDLKSAYPAVLHDMPDLRKGDWVDGLDETAKVGFVRIVIRSGDDYVPLLREWAGDTLVYPYFDEPVLTWVTLPEYLLLRRVATITVDDAITFRPSGKATYPWRELVLKLWKLKEESKSDPAFYRAVKETLNSFYGKTCEKTKRKGEWWAGRLFCPPVAAMITGQVRAWVGEAVQKAGSETIMVATDCVATTKPIDLRFGKELGEWDIEAENAEGLFVQPGIYEIDGDRPHVRGFKHTGGLYELLREAEGKVATVYQRPWSSREAVRMTDIEKANVFHDHTYTLSVTNRRRLWKRKVETFGELLDSRVDSFPVPMSLIRASR